MGNLSTQHPLRRLFAGLTEHAFISTLGMADPPLVDYVSDLLTRFLHVDAVYRLHDFRGKPVTEVAEMVFEAEQLPAEGRTRLEYHRHIGDFTLFWTGLYPEAIRRSRSTFSKDVFVSYTAQGKRSYHIASTCDDDQEEAGVLRRLSDTFELCAMGLQQVRKDFESMPADDEHRKILS